MQNFFLFCNVSCWIELVVGEGLDGEAGGRRGRRRPPSDGDDDGAFLHLLEQPDRLLVGHALNGNAVDGKYFVSWKANLEETV